MNSGGTIDNDDASVEAELAEQRPWTRSAQAIGAVIWPSFLSAGFATMLFFAAVDPDDIVLVLNLPEGISPMTGYGLGFFFFWLITGLSSTISIFMIRTARRNRNQRREKFEAHGKGDE
jgi:hypothetical protein